MSALLDDVSVVIRGAGERTLALCRRLLEDVFPPDHVQAIALCPFTAAVRRTCELGSDAGRTWTLAVDADVLVHADALRAFIGRAERAPRRVFQLQGRILDKPFGGPRDGGPHLFRTEHLALALRFAGGGGAAARPEFHMLRSMAARGHPWLQGEDVLGLHDYEQLYCDLHRKARAHAHKHRAAIPWLEPMWLRLARVDPDYRLLFLGLEAGRRDSAPLVDAREFPEIDALLEAEGLKEKAPLTADALDARGVAAVIDAHRTPPEFREWERWCRRERARAMRAARRAGLAARARRFARGLLSWRR